MAGVGWGSWATLHWGHPGGMVRAKMGIRQGGLGAFHSECSGRTAELEVGTSQDSRGIGDTLVGQLELTEA